MSVFINGYENPCCGNCKYLRRLVTDENQDKGFCCVKNADDLEGVVKLKNEDLDMRCVYWSAK